MPVTESTLPCSFLRLRQKMLELPEAIPSPRHLFSQIISRQDDTGRD